MTFVALASLEAPAKKITIPTEQRQRKSRAAWIPTASQEVVLGKCPSGVAKVLRGMFRVESKIIEWVDSGRNPFSMDENGPAHIVFDQLRAGSTNQTSVRMAFSEHLGWGPKPSAVRASVTIRALREAGVVVVENDGQIVTNPRLNGNTVSLDYVRE